MWFFCFFCLCMWVFNSNWWFSFIGRSIDVFSLNLNWMSLPFPYLTCNFFFIVHIGNLKEITEALKTYLHSSVNAGLPKRKVKWTLWCNCICHQQHTICHAISDIDHFHFWDYLLLHGPSSSWILTLPVLRVVPLCKCHCCWEPDDGYSKHCP